MVVGGTAVVYRVETALLWLLAAAVYLASLAAAVFLIGLFVGYDGGINGFWQPWQVISLAWHVRPSPSGWIKFLTVGTLPLLLCLSGMSVSLRIAKKGVGRYVRTLVSPARHCRLPRQSTRR